MTPKDHRVRVLSRRDYGQTAFRLDLHAPELAAQLQPGQFLQVSVGTGGQDPLLRRPLGYLTRDAAAGTISVLVQIIGRGTALLREAEAGDTLSVLGPLGRGFDLNPPGAALLVGGGIGVVPLLDLAAALLARRIPVTFVYAARTEKQLYALDELERLGLEPILATDDGSAGLRGTAVDALAGCDLKNYRFYYACGPRPMLARIREEMATAGIPGELSLEERMACGFGACLGCAVAVRGPLGTFYKRVCVDGPVFSAAEVSLDA